MEMETPEKMKTDLTPVMHDSIKIQDIIIQPIRHVITYKSNETSN